MRFSSPEQVKEWADSVVLDDLARFRENLAALNPFCTPGARNDWQRGYDNLGCRSYESSVDYDTIYQRGRAMRRLLDSLGTSMEQLYNEENES